MIRINLLPFRAARKKENIRRQVSIFILLIIFACVALYYLTLMVDRDIQRTKDQIANLNQQITLYKEKADRVTQIKRNLDILQTKLELVKNLEAKRREPVRLLEAMTRLVIPQRMWLTNLKSDESGLQLKGIAFDNKTVADFMTRLEGSGMFAGIDLKKLELKKLDKDVQMKAFELVCTALPGKIQEQPKKTGKK
ncbi:MAG: PilN domain-containing protein [Pseudomonadota bacterium]